MTLASDRRMAEGRTILRTVVGSTVHGINIGDSIEDRDEMGICVEPFNRVVGFNSFEQMIYRSAAEREGNPNARSKAGDLDLTIFSLRKYIRLALKGNPTVLIPLFVKDEDCIVLTELGRQLRMMSEKIISKRAGRAFIGYMEAQISRLKGERSIRSKRPELVEKYGFDTKFAMHALRLGAQGKELMTTGKLTLPMEEPRRSFLRQVREGLVPFNECIFYAEQAKCRIEDALKSTWIPDSPDEKYVEAWMLEVYREFWKLDDCL